MVHVLQGPFEHDHREDARARADVAGARCDGVRGDHAGAGVSLGRAERDAGVQRAGRIQQRGALGRQLACGLSCHQHLGEQCGEAQSGRGVGDETVEPPQQLRVVVLRGGIDREHPRCVAHSEHLAAGEPLVHVAGERREGPYVRDVRLAVEHGLVQVRDRPAQRDVGAEGLRQLGCGAPGARVAPGAEGHQKLVVLIEGEVAVHHRRHSDRAEGLQSHVVALFDVGDQIPIRSLKTRPHVLERVGPDPIDEPVLPLVTADGEHLRGVVADQACLDAGRPELDAQRRAPGEDRLPLCIGGGTVHGGLLVE